MPTLGGFTMVRNGNLLDFCWKPCVESMLGVCDVVAISIAKGEDSTEEEAREWAVREPRISINIYPWPSPVGNPDWFVEWIQYARMHTQADWVLELDADEVLHENSYDEVRRFIQTPNRAARCTRWNFWRDHRHLIPLNECLARYVNRIAPQNVWMASDGDHPMGHQLSNMAVDTGIQIGHYGFLRKPEAFFKKERQLQGFFFNSYDKRLERVEKSKEWMRESGINDWQDRVEEFKGTHPKIMGEWLKNHGYK